jgi:Ribosomal L38e protein family
MPRLITTAEQFEELKSKAVECRVVRSEKAVKLKLRTPSFLYTYITSEEEAEDIIKGLKDIEVVEFTPVKKEDKDTGKKKEKAKKEEEEGEAA